MAVMLVILEMMYCIFTILRRLNYDIPFNLTF